MSTAVAPVRASASSSRRRVRQRGQPGRRVRRRRLERRLHAGERRRRKRGAVAVPKQQQPVVRLEREQHALQRRRGAVDQQKRRARAVCARRRALRFGDTALRRVQVVRHGQLRHVAARRRLRQQQAHAAALVPGHVEAARNPPRRIRPGRGGSVYGGRLFAAHAVSAAPPCLLLRRGRAPDAPIVPVAAHIFSIYYKSCRPPRQSTRPRSPSRPCRYTIHLGQEKKRDEGWGLIGYSWSCSQQLYERRPHPSWEKV